MPRGDLIPASIIEHAKAGLLATLTNRIEAIYADLVSKCPEAETELRPAIDTLLADLAEITND